LWDTLVVLANGDVTVCCYDYNGVLNIGNIKNNSIKELWNSPQLKQLRKIHYKRGFDKIPLCSKCDAILKK
jgi:radical SAM protein with 4Fe4S-binding SPASM domain